MDNDRLTEMSNEEFTATIKRLHSHAETQSQLAFQSGDRQRFDLWDYRRSQLRAITITESWGLRK